MTKYVDENYYKNSYKGALDVEQLENLIITASKHIQNHTSNRADSSMEEVKYCCCVLVDKIQEYNTKKAENKKQGRKKSETVGKWAVNYADVKTDKELEKELEEEIDNIIKFYLLDITDKDGVNLLYRGN